MKKDIVDIMIDQHNTLRAEIQVIKDMDGTGEGDSAHIVKKMAGFKADLDEHWALENDVFYVDLLKRKEDLGLDTSYTKGFMASMNQIGKKVHGFLGKYETEESIQKDFKSFQEEFHGVAELIRLRVESEEASVFKEWEALSKSV